MTQQAQPSAGLPVRVRKAHHLWAVANYMVAAHDEVGHRDVRILDEFPKRERVSGIVSSGSQATARAHGGPAGSKAAVSRLRGTRLFRKSENAEA